MIKIPGLQISKIGRVFGLLIAAQIFAMPSQAAAPSASDDTATVIEGATIASIDVLANDSDSDGDAISITAVNYSGVGTVTFTSSSLSYTPPTNFSGQVNLTETVIYTVSDGALTDTGTLTITVTAVNDAPVAIDDSEALTEDPGLTNITVLNDDTDADGDTLSVTAVSTTGTGTVAVNADGVTIDYTPALNFNGTETITYTVSDGVLTDTGTLTITVAAVNDAPVAVDDSVVILQDSTIDIEVLDNDSDNESSLSISSHTNPSFGTATVNGNAGTISYVPNAGYSGADSFDYVVTDSDGATSTATVNITVNAAVVAACSPNISAVSGNCSISPTNQKMRVLAFGLCTSPGPTRPETTSAYDISSCELIYDGRQTSGVSVSVAGGTSVNFGGNLTIPPYGNYTHGILIVDNTFTIQGELTLSSGTNRYCYIEDTQDTNSDGIGDTEADLDGDGVNDLFVNCRATALTSPPEAENTISNFFDLAPAIYSHTFTTDRVTIDLVTDESTASTLSSSNAASDAILAIQTFDSPKNFNEFTKSIDIGVRISESLVVGSGGADTSPFSIRFSVE